MKQVDNAGIIGRAWKLDWLKNHVHVHVHVQVQPSKSSRLLAAIAAKKQHREFQVHK